MKQFVNDPKQFVPEMLKGIALWRSYLGEYCTSLEMAGLSITVCRVDETIEGLLLAPAELPIRVF